MTKRCRVTAEEVAEAFMMGQEYPDDLEAPDYLDDQEDPDDLEEQKQMNVQTWRNSIRPNESVQQGIYAV